MRPFSFGFGGQQIGPHIGPILEQVCEWVFAVLEGVWIAGADIGIVFAITNQLRSLARILLREQATNRFNRLEVRVPVIKIAIGKCQIHRLINRMDITGRVIAHLSQRHGRALATSLCLIGLQDIERLQHGRSLRPVSQFEDLDPAISGLHWLFNLHAPIRQIFASMQAPLLFRATDKFIRNVSAIKTFVGGQNGFTPIFTGLQRLGLRIHQFLQRGEQVRLPPNLPHARRASGRTISREECFFRVRPRLELFSMCFQLAHELGFDGIAARQFHRRCKDFLQRKFAELCEHDHEAAWVARR